MFGTHIEIITRAQLLISYIENFAEHSACVSVWHLEFRRVSDVFYFLPVFIRRFLFCVGVKKWFSSVDISLTDFVGTIFEGMGVLVAGSSS